LILDLPAARSASIRFYGVQEKEAELMLREAQDSNPKSTIQNPKYELPVVGIILKGLISRVPISCSPPLYRKGGCFLFQQVLIFYMCLKTSVTFRNGKKINATYKTKPILEGEFIPPVRAHNSFDSSCRLT